MTARLGLPLEEARRRVPANCGKPEATIDGTLFRGSFDDLDRAARWLPTLHCPVVVREPAELRATLGRLAAELAATAGFAGGGER